MRNKAKTSLLRAGPANGKDAFGNDKVGLIGYATLSSVNLFEVDIVSFVADHFSGLFFLLFTIMLDTI